MFYLKLLVGEYWWLCLAAIAAIISIANFYIYFFEGAACAALEEGEAGPKKGLQEGFE
jgi:hypothetical protein